MTRLRNGRADGDVGFYASQGNNIQFLSYAHQSSEELSADAVADALLGALALQRRESVLCATAWAARCENDIVKLMCTVTQGGFAIGPVNTDKHQISLFSVMDTADKEALLHQLEAVLPSGPMEVVHRSRPLFQTSRQVHLTAELASVCADLVVTQPGVSWYATTWGGTYMHISI